MPDFPKVRMVIQDIKKGANAPFFDRLSSTVLELNRYKLTTLTTHHAKVVDSMGISR